MTDYGTIRTMDEDGQLNVVIETPKGSRNKYKFDEDLKVFKLSKTLPAGSVFPFDFGFIPSTLAEDGDPLDLLVLMEEPAFPGCLIKVRLLGVIEAMHTKKGKKPHRNDRLIGVHAESKNFAEYKKLNDLSENLLAEIEHFFISYQEMEGNNYKPIKRNGPVAAKKLVEEGQKRTQVADGH